MKGNAMLARVPGVMQCHKSDIIMHYREEILKFQSVTHIMLCSRNCAKPLTNINTFNPPNNQRRKVILALPYRFRHRATGKLCNSSPSRYQYRHSLPEHCFLNSYPQQSPGHLTLYSQTSLLVSRK